MKINLLRLNRIPLLFVLAVVACLTGPTSIAQSDSKVTVGPVSILPPAPALEAKAAGEVKPFELAQSGLKQSILNHPIPEATLVFVMHDKQDDKITVQLPEEAKKLLLECWHADLTFYYLRTFEFHDLQTRITERNVFGNVVGNVHAKLQTLTIDTPTGKRNISYNEAASLTSLMDNSAQCVVNEAKDSLGSKPDA